MIRNLIRKFGIVYKKTSNHFKRAFAEFKEEVFIIVRNRNYSKKHPQLFAIFSIIEQEQNTQIFELQTRNFKIIKSEILKDENITNHKILEYLRSIFHNNKLIEDETKIKLATFLKKEVRKLINQNNPYYTPLIKVILFSFPFLINHQNYDVFYQLLKRKSSNSLKVIKDLFHHYETLEFLMDPDDIKLLLIMSMDLNNKPAFMIMIRFLRQKENLKILFDEKSFMSKSKILNSDSSEFRGFDYDSIFLSYLSDEFISEKIYQKLERFFQEIFSAEVTSRQKAKRYDKINNYIILSKKLGREFLVIENFLRKYVQDCEFSKAKTRSQILRIKKLQKSLFKMKSHPRANVSVRSIMNFTNQHPEEYWLMQFAPYLL